jgi:Tfp pilus assembly protein PilW
MTLAETLVATAIGAFVLVGVMTTYIISVRSFAAISNYDKIHGDGRITMEYFSRDMRAVTNIVTFSNSSNITVLLPTGFNATGAVTNTATVTYSTSAGALYRYDSRTGKTDLLATNISQATFTLYDLAGNTNSVALNNAKGISLNLKLQTFVGSRVQSEDYLSAAYDMRNTAN